MSLNIEIAILQNSLHRLENCIRDPERSVELARLLVQGRYETILTSEVGRQILGTGASLSDGQRSMVDAFLQSNVEHYLCQQADGNPKEGEFGVLAVAVACLQLFSQNNWVGPPTTLDPWQLLPHGQLPSDQLTVIQEGAASSLVVDGEAVYSLAAKPLYLLLAKTILLDCRHLLSHCQTVEIWLMRCLQTQQAVMEERCPTLKATIMDLMQRVSEREVLMTSEEYRDVQVQFHVEAGHLCYFYYEPTQASSHFQKAKKLTGLGIQLTGVMGRRTKFQQKALAQLLLKVERTSEPASPPDTHTDTTDTPKDVALNDDTVLEQITLEEPEDFVRTPVSQVEQAVLLALCHEHKKHSGSHGDILKEECLAFITSVLSQADKNWSVHSMALLLRTYWESESPRRMERTMAQLEELVGQFDRPSTCPSSRTHLVYCSRWQPRWYVQKELGDLLMKVGATKAALEVYLRIAMWEEVIKCYKQLGRTESAEKVIRKQMAIRETPGLWCHLGDTLQDPECYKKAWELSEHHFPKAQRLLAFYHLNKGQFEESLPCFEKSLKINPLQVEVWFSYGCAAMAIRRWEESARAFRRCVTLNPDNYEAWSNLSAVYTRSNQKSRAFTTLQEALKCEYENWRLWENYLLLGTDVGEFQEAIRAYHRLLDLRNKHIETEVLAVLVRAVVEGITDSESQSAARLRPKVLELFGRITSKVTGTAKVWRLYSQLLTDTTEVISQTDRQRAVQYLQKSHRCLTQTPNWEKDVDRCKEVAQESTDLAKTYQNMVKQEVNGTQASQLLSSGRLMLKTTLTTIQKQHTDPLTGELKAELVDSCNSLDSELKTIVETLAQLRETT